MCVVRKCVGECVDVVRKCVESVSCSQEMCSRVVKCVGECVDVVRKCVGSVSM